MAGGDRRGLVGLAVALGVGLAGCGPREPIVAIGFVAPLTGDQAPHGEDMLHGAQLAIEHAVAQGPILPGHRLQLVPLDDQRNPTQAVAAAKRLVSDPDVVVVVGHLNSSCTMPASAIYHQARLLQVSPVSSNPQISRQGFDTFFRTCATDDLQGPAAARFAVCDLGARRIFILDDMTTYGRGLANEFEKKLKEIDCVGHVHPSGGLSMWAPVRIPVEMLGHEGITQGDKEFTPLLTKIKALGPDLVYFAGMFPEAALLLKQRFEIGLQAQFMTGDGTFDPVLIQLATPQAAEGSYLTTIGSDIHQVPTAQEFLKAYEAKFGRIGAYSAYAYEATNLAIWAIRQAGKKDRTAVLAAMQQLKQGQAYNGLFGPQRFDEKGDSLIRDIGIFTVRDGTFAFVKSATWE